MIDPNLVFAGITGTTFVVGTVVWAVRLEGRVNGNDRALKTNEKRFDRVDAAVAKVDEKVESLTDYLLRKNGDKT